MELSEGIKTRRSIRNYTSEVVTIDDINKIVDLAKCAPSWKNTQTTRYYVILDKDLKSHIAENCVAGFSWNSGNINKAPALVVVATVNGKSGYESDGTFSTSKGTHWQSFDAGIATQTFCLAAHNYGFGTLIMGIFDEKAVAEAISLPQGLSVSALVAIGKEQHHPEMPHRLETQDLVSLVK
ncbi:MAG: nitroreductase family protein [Succinivibrionaceae bacterium]